MALQTNLQVLNHKPKNSGNFFGIDTLEILFVNPKISNPEPQTPNPANFESNQQLEFLTKNQFEISVACYNNSTDGHLGTCIP